MGYKSFRILCFLGICSTMSPGLRGQKKGLTPVAEWKELDYAYDTEAERQAAISNGEFVRGSGIIIDSDVYYGNNGDIKLFATVPRFSAGTPGTLNTVTNKKNNDNPLLKPYPSWEWHRNSAECRRDRLVSVFRTQIDECKRLWVLDTGKINTAQLCNPQIIAFNPSTDEVVHRYEIPRDQIFDASILVTPVVDVRDPHAGCQDTFIYAADVTGFGLIVYDVKKRISWRITNKLFYPIPEFGTFTIAGESFDLMDGLLGMALSPLKQGYNDRTLFFHAMASNTENHVSTSVIRNMSIFQNHEEAVPREFEVFRRERRSQAAAEAIDKQGIMYFASMNEINMQCWNINTDFGPRQFDVVDNNRNTLQFPSGVKIVNNNKGSQELWVVTNRIQKLYTGTMNSNEVNQRILSATTADLTLGTRCRGNTGGGGGGGGGYGFNRPPGGGPPVWAPAYGRRTNRLTDTPSEKVETTSDMLVFGN